MRKQSEIDRAIEALRMNGDGLSEVQIEVLERRRNEQWVFGHFVRDTPETERDEAAFYAARDAARFLAGKVGISALCPELEDETEPEAEEGITLSRKEYDALLKRLDRVERRLGLRSQINKETRKPAAETDATDLISQAEACRYIGCGKSTIKRWADRGLVTGYLKGKRVYYSRRELDRSEVVREHRAENKEKEECHGTDHRNLAE